MNCFAHALTTVPKSLGVAAGFSPRKRGQSNQGGFSLGPPRHYKAPKARSILAWGAAPGQVGGGVQRAEGPT
jgi:hypothetical protein